jgi:hypothetical protein
MVLMMYDGPGMVVSDVGVLWSSVTAMLGGSTIRLCQQHVVEWLEQ